MGGVLRLRCHGGGVPPPARDDDSSAYRRARCFLNGVRSLQTTAILTPSTNLTPSAQIRSPAPPSISHTMAPIAEGDTIPSVTFVTRVRIPAEKADNPENPFDWKKVTSEDIFKVHNPLSAADARSPRRALCAPAHLPSAMSPTVPSFGSVSRNSVLVCCSAVWD